MTIEEAKRRAELYSALADGKAIQVQNPVTSKWEYLDINKIEELNYRIKPEPKCRPFRTQEECWEEMHKHPDFGWVIRTGVYLNVFDVYSDAIHTPEDQHGIDFDDAFNELTFTDGEPFGIKEK